MPFIGLLGCQRARRQNNLEAEAQCCSNFIAIIQPVQRNVDLSPPPRDHIVVAVAVDLEQCGAEPEPGAGREFQNE